MSDIASARPVSGQPIATAWGGEIHDQLEGLQAGTVSVSGITSTVTGTKAVVFPKPYATAPVIVVSNPSGVVNVGAASLTVTGFTAQARRIDGSGTATTQPVNWIAVGKLA